MCVCVCDLTVVVDLFLLIKTFIRKISKKQYIFY